MDGRERMLRRNTKGVTNDHAGTKRQLALDVDSPGCAHPLSVADALRTEVRTDRRGMNSALRVAPFRSVEFTPRIGVADFSPQWVISVPGIPTPMLPNPLKPSAHNALRPARLSMDYVIYTARTCKGAPHRELLGRSFRQTRSSPLTPSGS